ncbi:MAG: ABC transporter permease [Brevefilum sp.]|nr:ABC transporter permease [Brevefilum sp.]
MTSSTIPEKRSDTLISDRPIRKSFLSIFLKWEWFLFVLILVVFFINTRLSPFFLNAANLSRTSSDFMEIGLMMLPMVLIIITGNIDLSVASNMGMSASFMGLLHNMGVNIWVAALAGLTLGTLGGVLNGYLVAKVKLPALVVTLGTFAFFRGIAFGFLGDQAARNYPSAFTYFGQGRVFNTLIPFSVVLFSVLAVLFGVVLHRTTIGRYLYTIGNNEQAAKYSGVPVDRIKFLLFIVSGFMSALAGLILAARFGSTRPDNGTGLELAVITAAVLGGLDINGGKGSMYGATLALLLIGLLRFGMGLLNIQSQVQSMVIGLLLIISILIPHIGQQITFTRHIKLRWKTILAILAMVAVFAAFFVFFFWSRAPIIARF